MPTSLAQIKNAELASSLFVNRREAGAIANSSFYSGDHWQNNAGWIGAKPLIGVTGFSQTMAQIKEAFVSENVIGEVIERHIAGVLGREPLWGFVPQKTVSERAVRRRRRFGKLFGGFLTDAPQPAALDKRAQEADEALTVWWDQGRPRQKLKEALATTLNEERVLLRFFVPQGLRDKNGSVPIQSNLSDALDLLHLDIVKADKGGVFIDEDTQNEFGLYVYERDGENFAELTYVNELGQTVLQLLEKESAGEAFTYDLGKRLWMYEMVRSSLITEQVRSNQRSLNLALTMMMRNVNLAGSLERTVMNAERPKTSVQIKDATQPSGYREEKRDADYFTGAGATMFLTGLLIRNDNGEVIGRANPNISFREPVDVKTFRDTRDQFYSSILGQCQQRHALISGDATSSGKSREQARAEFRGSLMLTKESLDDTGRWMMEAGLRLAAQFCNRTKEFADLRCDFGSLVEDGPIDSTERQENRADVQAGLMSKETAMSRGGAEDTDSEFQRIQEDLLRNDPVLPRPPIDKPNGGASIIG